MSYIVKARVRRDAHTTTPVTVRPHEIPILQAIFGEENVHSAAGQVFDLKAITAADIVKQTPLADDEFGRLAAKYGLKDGVPMVEQVYGKKATGGLDAAIKSSEATIAAILTPPAAPSKKDAGTDDTTKK